MQMKRDGYEADKNDIIVKLNNKFINISFEEINESIFITYEDNAKIYENIYNRYYWSRWILSFKTSSFKTCFGRSTGVGNCNILTNSRLPEGKPITSLC